MRMRPSADPRAPGIYQTFDAVAPPPLSIANTRITGFVGITQKGPMNEPTRLVELGRVRRDLRLHGRLVHLRLGLRLLPERRHRLLGRPRRAHRAEGRAAEDRARVVRRARADRRLEQAVAQDPRAQRGHVGQHDLVPLRPRPRRAGAADARPRHRLRRGARQHDARLRGRLARCGSTTARTPTSS